MDYMISILVLRVFALFILPTIFIIVMYFIIKKLSLSLYNEYSTDTTNRFVTNKIKTFIRFIIPITLLVYITADVISARNYNYYGEVIGSFIVVLVNIIIIWYFDYRMRILVYLQKNLFLFVLLNLLLFILISISPLFIISI